MANRERGARGEAIACSYLSKKGYKILARNFRTRVGEVDIVGRTENTIVFVEVKSWRTFDPDGIERAIDWRKQRRIIETARVYLAGGDRDLALLSVRFDVVLVLPDERTVRHIEGAFESEWAE